VARPQANPALRGTKAATHFCVPPAMIDPEWAKRQLILLLREWYMHPSGQLPTYEWRLEDYRGLARRRPVLAGVFTAMLLSLAGMPLTAGFVGKFLILSAGVGATLWTLVLVMVAASVVGLFYYLRVVIEMCKPPESRAEPAERAPSAPAADMSAEASAKAEAAGYFPPATSAPNAVAPLSLAGGIVLMALVLALVLLGVYPAPLLGIIDSVAPREYTGGRTCEAPVGLPPSAYLPAAK